MSTVPPLLVCIVIYSIFFLYTILLLSLLHPCIHLNPDLSLTNLTICHRYEYINIRPTDTSIQVGADLIKKLMIKYTHSLGNCCHYFFLVPMLNGFKPSSLGIAVCKVYHCATAIGIFGMYAVFFMYTILLLPCLYSGILTRVGFPWTEVYYMYL